MKSSLQTTLPIKGLDESDVLGWCFVNYPTFNTNEQNIEQLEYEILNLWDEECDRDKVSDEEREWSGPAISPYWLFRLDCSKNEKSLAEQVSKLPANLQDVYFHDVSESILEYRAKNHGKIKTGEVRRFPDIPSPSKWLKDRKAAARARLIERTLSANPSSASSVPDTNVSSLEQTTTKKERKESQ